MIRISQTSYRFCIALALLILAMIGNIGTTVNAATPPPQSTLIKINVGGLARSYRLHIPPAATSGKQLPLVLSLHGASANAISQEQGSKMDTTADQNAFVVAYPEGTSGPIASQHFWNAGDCCSSPVTKKIDDVAFLIAVINNISSRTPIDSHRVYVTGFSNGGMMAYRMASMASKRVAAIASVAGQVEMTINPTRAVPTLEIHSMDDKVALWNGGDVLGYHFRPVMDGINQWVDKEHCRRPAEISAPIVGTGANAGATSRYIVFTQCTGGSVVSLWRFTGVPHGWPGGPYSASQKTKTPLNTNNAIWQFLKNKKS